MTYDYEYRTYHIDVDSRLWSTVLASDLHEARQLAGRLVATEYLRDGETAAVTITHPICELWPDGLTTTITVRRAP
jgi:hypothetical protein